MLFCHTYRCLYSKMIFILMMMSYVMKLWIASIMRRIQRLLMDFTRKESVMRTVDILFAVILSALLHKKSSCRRFVTLQFDVTAVSMPSMNVYHVFSFLCSQHPHWSRRHITMGLYATTVDLVGCVLGPRKIVGLIILSSCCVLIYNVLVSRAKPWSWGGGSGGWGGGGGEGTDIENSGFVMMHDDADILSLLATHAAIHLTHGSRDKIAAILQTTFSNYFSSYMKIVVFRLAFHRNLFPWFQWTIFHHWFR